MTCRFCHEDLSKLPQETNVWRHQTGLCIPSRNEVEAAIDQLEIEDRREKEAIRKFWELQRSRKPSVFHSWTTFWIVVGCFIAVGLMLAAIFGR